LSDQTGKLIGARELGWMKPTACLINTARGPIVDEEALVEVLRARRIGGAGLDVFETGPIRAGHRNVAAVAQGRAPRYAVNRDVLARWRTA